MPRFKGSCGAYSKEDALELGLTAAVIWNDILNRAEWLDTTKIYYEQNKASDRLGIPRQTINANLKKLESSGRIIISGGYIPNTSIRTTFIEITEDYVSDSSDDNELHDNQEAENGIPKEAENGIPYIKYDTNINNTNIKRSNQKENESADSSLVSEYDDQVDSLVPDRVDIVGTEYVEASVMHGDGSELFVVPPRNWNKFINGLRKSERKGDEKPRSRLTALDAEKMEVNMTVTVNQLSSYRVVRKLSDDEREQAKRRMAARNAGI